MKILLIAYGNPYRGDDGIGAWILQKGDSLLFQRLPAPFPEERNGYICHPEERSDEGSGHWSFHAKSCRQDPSQRQLRMTRKDGSGGQSPSCHAEPFASLKGKLRDEASGIDQSMHRQDSFTSLRFARGQAFEDRPSASPQEDRKESKDDGQETEGGREGIEGVKKGTPSVDKLVLQELTLDLAETLAKYNLVVFIDAAISGEPVTWRELKADNVSSPLSHHLPPEKLLFYAELLYQKTPHAFLLSVRGDSFEFEEHLSPAAQKNSRLALKQLEDFLLAEYAKIGNR